MTHPETSEIHALSSALQSRVPPLCLPPLPRHSTRTACSRPQYRGVPSRQQALSEDSPTPLEPPSAHGPLQRPPPAALPQTRCPRFALAPRRQALFPALAAQPPPWASPPPHSPSSPPPSLSTPKPSGARPDPQAPPLAPALAPPFRTTPRLSSQGLLRVPPTFARDCCLAHGASPLQKRQPTCRLPQTLTISSPDPSFPRAPWLRDFPAPLGALPPGPFCPSAAAAPPHELSLPPPVPLRHRILRSSPPDPAPSSRLPLSETLNPSPLRERRHRPPALIESFPPPPEPSSAHALSASAPAPLVMCPRPARLRILYHRRTGLSTPTSAAPQEPPPPPAFAARSRLVPAPALSALSHAPQASPPSRFRAVPHLRHAPVRLPHFSPPHSPSSPQPSPSTPKPSGARPDPQAQPPAPALAHCSQPTPPPFLPAQPPTFAPGHRPPLAPRHGFLR
eukprot:Hpha_TRINITY_DN16926_c2_g1::TRINITY_DN16926_c2_g1_i7::g.52772::m.52772